MDSALATLTRVSEDLWQAVQPLLPGFSVEVVTAIDSTNTELMRRARSGQHGPVLLVALEQTAGRGRRGKAWVSQPGDSLTFSLGLPLAPADWSGLSLAVGVGLAEHLHPEIRLKWPNDLWWQGRKLGGILVETASVGAQRYAVVGVGLNLATPTVPMAQGSQGSQGSQATSEGGVPVAVVPPVGLRALPGEHGARDAGQWLAALVPALVQDLLLFERDGFAAFARRFAALDALVGLQVQLSDGQTGMVAGVGPGGALRLQTVRGVVDITSAEVSVRPC